MMQASIEVKLRPARPDEAADLSTLCLRSKASWGYDAGFMEACRQELTLTSDDISTGHVAVAEGGNQVLGMVEIAVTGETVMLEKLFVSPDVMGRGVGRSLFEWARLEAVRRGAGTIVMDADPGAAAFYRLMGAADDGWIASGSIPGRYLPRLRLAL